MKQILLTLTLLCSLFVPLSLFASEPPGQIAIFPSMFELQIGSKPVNESIRLKNMKKKPVTIKTDVYNWTLDRQNNLQIIPGTPQSLDRWMIINPLTFTIDPGQEQVVRFSIRPGVKPEPGEHRAIVYFTEQPDEQDVNAAVQVTFRIGVGIYAYADPVRQSATLQNISFDAASSTIKAHINNSGNVHTRLKGAYTVWEKGTFPGFGKTGSKTKPVTSGTLNNLPVLPGENRVIETPISLPGKPGLYAFAVSGSINGKNVEKLLP